MAEKVDDKDDKEITEVATIASNNNPEIGKKLAEAMKKVGASNGVITVEEGKTAETEVVSSRACSSTGAFCRHISSPTKTDGLRAGKPLYPHLRGQDLPRKNLIPLLETISKKKEPLLDHRRGHRRRCAGDAGGQQAEGHPSGLCREGPGLWRPPQGNAGRHRHA